MNPALDAGRRGSLGATLRAVALLGPGLPDWPTAAPLLRDPSRWLRVPTVVPSPARLPPNERRRAGWVVKASVAVADAAAQAAGIAPTGLPTVFTSSTGDPANCHAMCEALAAAERLVSPTRFTNSVHNVAAGYWHIATQSMRASTSLGAFDASLSAGLLEAAAQVASHAVPVLLVACDVPYPEPLHGVRALSDTLALAMVLAPAVAPGPAGTAGARGDREPAAPPREPGRGRSLHLRLAGDERPTRCSHPALEQLRTQIPAARALPLLQALAGDGAARVVLEGLDGCALAVEVDAA